jgi:branched-chain amino acid transport system substrate-binding protein
VRSNLGHESKGYFFFDGKRKAKENTMRKRRFCWKAYVGVLAFAFLCSGTLLPDRPALAQPKVVKVGNILPLSGPSASVGQQNKNSQDMAIEEINAAGGIKSLGGTKITMLYADSESKPDKGVAEAERLINTEKVNVLTGCWNSAVTYPTTAVAERYGIPFIVPVSVADKITEQGFKTVFRIAAKDSWWTRDQFVFLSDLQKEFNKKISMKMGIGARDLPTVGRNLRERAAIKLSWTSPILQLLRT